VSFGTHFPAQRRIDAVASRRPDSSVGATRGSCRSTAWRRRRSSACVSRTPTHAASRPVRRILLLSSVTTVRGGGWHLTRPAHEIRLETSWWAGLRRRVRVAATTNTTQPACSTRSGRRVRPVPKPRRSAARGRRSSRSSLSSLAAGYRLDRSTVLDGGESCAAGLAAVGTPGRPRPAMGGAGPLGARPTDAGAGRSTNCRCAAETDVS
jgi:hypothetical protein